ncbi:Protein MALE DISCOVERER 1 [Linum grandiflorum]
MEGRSSSSWNTIGTQFLCFLVFIVGFEIRGSWSLNDEELILFEFRTRVRSDPYGVLANWNLHDDNPCLWNLSGCSLEGTLTPEIGKLVHLRSLLLRDNCFYGVLPTEIGSLKKLEILDVRDNNFSGTIPIEIGRSQTLKCLWVSGNKFEGIIPGEMRRLKLLSHLELDGSLVSTTSFAPFSNVNRMFENELWKTRIKHPRKEATLRRRLQEQQLQQQGSNLAAEPASKNPPSSQDMVNFVPITRGSGAFPAIPDSKFPSNTGASPDEDGDDGNGPNDDDQDAKKGPIEHNHAQWDALFYFFLALMVVFLLAFLVILLILWRRRGGKTITPWKTGLSGQLQKAFVSGVPKLNRLELETACEEFSNIIEKFDGGTVYKGTLSSGIEIAVVSTSITSLKDWSRTAEKAYCKKIDTLSRVNHKNFVNLIGFCEENEPFTRVMVLEYAPNGSLFEHIHDEHMDPLDWTSRMRIIMGVAYCLQHMHHDITPPVPHTHLNSRKVYLSDDYAAKIVEVPFLSQAASRAEEQQDDSEHSELPAMADPETNVYSFGVIVLEVLTGKLPYSEKDGPIEKWAAKYLEDKSRLSEMADPSLKANFKTKDFEVLCEVAHECTNQDPRQRPQMKDIVPRLREVIGITGDQAVPRLSPLWWAELELLEDS